MECVYEGPCPAVKVHVGGGKFVVVEHGESQDFRIEVARSLEDTGDWKIKSPKGNTKAASGGKE